MEEDNPPPPPTVKSRNSSEGSSELDDGEGLLEVEEYTLYKDRPEWKDVIPIPPDEGGGEPVVQIEYSTRFRDVYDYFRGVVKTGEKSERVVSLTEDAITLNAANYTVWQYRRDVLEALGVPGLITMDGLPPKFDKEFDFSRQMILRNQKNYQVWHHRKSLVAWAAGYNEEDESIELKDRELIRKLTRIELSLTEKILGKDAKNYHAWQHREWVLITFKVFEGELDFVTKLIDDDCRNNSAWNERYFIVSNLPDLGLSMLNDEATFTWGQIGIAVSNESAWNYIRGLYLLYQGVCKTQNIEEVGRFVEQVISKCAQEYGEGKCRSIPMMSSFVEFITIQLKNRKIKELYETGLQVLQSLQETDVIRQKYWKHVEQEFRKEEEGSVTS